VLAQDRCRHCRRAQAGGPAGGAPPHTAKTPSRPAATTP